MSFLEMCIQSPVAGAIGWTLLHSLWEGAIVSALLAMFLLAVRSPRARYAAACGALSVMLLGFGITFWQMWPAAVNNTVNVRQAGFPVWNAATTVASPDGWNVGLEAIAPWLAPFWIFGVCILLLRHGASCLSVKRMRRRGVCSASEQWQKHLEQLRAELGVSRPVLLLESCLAEAPLVLGYFRPLILMPVGLFTGLPAGQIEAILLHELAHIRRCDYLVNILQRPVECLLFYHPAMWWISRVIRTERENCCDDVAVATKGDAHEYASALAALETYRWSGVATVVAATGGNIVKRIRRLLYPKAPTAGGTPFIAAFLLIAAGSVLLAGWRANPSQQTTANGQTQSEAHVLPYSKWLNEDVVYIIDDAERAAFQKLTTNEEREKFIEQFWARRDPTPGTPENEFKDEHYRRIEFANKHFRTASGTPGWKTDRGHIYIVYGPPDEIDSHLGGTVNTSRAYELWTYRHVEGVGDNVSITFVDETGRGDYRIAPTGAR